MGNVKPLRIGELSYMALSPAHCRYALDHEFEPTSAMKLGSLAHAIMLGKNAPVVYPGKARRGKEYEAFKATFAEGETIYLESEIESARQIARSLMDHPEAYRLMLGEREQTLTWTINGRECRGTPDILNRVGKYLTDLKTAVSAAPQRFPRQAHSLAYPAKLAWYVDGIKKALGLELERVFLVVAENKPPYAVTTYQLTDEAIEFGRATYMGWFNRFEVCEQSSEWPSYGPQWLEAPQENLVLEMDGEDVEVA